MGSVGRTVNTIPSHDVVLRRVVNQVAADLSSPSPAELQAKLRPLYPKIAVFEGHLSGELPHLYVYRDGRYEPEPTDSWWAEPGVASVRVSRRDGTMVAASDTWASLMGADEGTLVGRHYLDFVSPAAQPVARAMFDALDDEHEVRSKALVVRADGTTLMIEFRATRQDGEIEVFFRPLPQP
jgi:PAS domain S-box-containing protein